MTGQGVLRLIGETASQTVTLGKHVPHVVAWNLTRRCNLECAHCYISAGPGESATGELGTDEVLAIAEQILELNPAPLFILSGGEPLLRDDLGAIAAFATGRGATVVVGTNGTLLTDRRIAELKAAGVSGVAVSVDSLEPSYHDRFRHGEGSLAETAAAVGRLRHHRLDFVIQTTVTKGNHHELSRIAAWSAAQGAVCFNAYFLVPTGRGSRMTDLSPEACEGALEELVTLHRTYLGRMMVRAKCAPHFMRHIHRSAPGSPVLGYETRCPCGSQYCRITPDGKLTPCPYLPEIAGDLTRERFADVWRESPLFATLREGALGGKCGQCEYRRVCGGCRARAFAETGDVLAADSSCTYEPSGDATLVEPAGVTYGAAVAGRLRWAPAATARLERIPSFVRGVVAKRLEDFARERGLDEVTEDLVSEVRRALPIDFSKRRPFFLDDA